MTPKASLWLNVRFALQSGAGWGQKRGLRAGGGFGIMMGILRA